MNAPVSQTVTCRVRSPGPVPRRRSPTEGDYRLRSGTVWVRLPPPAPARSTTPRGRTVRDLVSLIRRLLRVRLTATPPRGARSLARAPARQAGPGGFDPRASHHVHVAKSAYAAVSETVPQGVRVRPPPWTPMSPWRNGIRSRLRTCALAGVWVRLPPVTPICMPGWRNWQTPPPQNRLAEGSTPSPGTGSLPWRTP